MVLVGKGKLEGGVGDQGVAIGDREVGRVSQTVPKPKI